jgi:hypothetical protein
MKGRTVMEKELEEREITSKERQFEIYFNDAKKAFPELRKKPPFVHVPLQCHFKMHKRDYNYTLFSVVCVKCGKVWVIKGPSHVLGFIDPNKSRKVLKQEALP